MKRLACIITLTLLNLLTWSQDSITVFDMRSGLPENRIRAICQMTDGRMAIATTATVEVYNGTRFTSYYLSPDRAYHLPRYNGHRRLTCDSAGRLWLRNDHTLYVVDTRRGMVVDDVKALLSELHLTDDAVAEWSVGQHYGGDTSAYVRDSYGGSWLGTRENGIVYTNARRARQFTTTTDSFAYQRIPNFVSPRASQLSARYAPSATNCTLDTDDYTYLGTRHGVLVISRSDSLVAIINEDYGLQTNNIASLLADHRGDVWVATAGGALSKLHIVGRDSFCIVNFSQPDGIRTEGREFRTCQIHRDAVSGHFTVGFVGGVVFFHPDSITAPRYTFTFPMPNNQSPNDQTNSSPYRQMFWWLLLLGLSVMFILTLWLRHKRTKMPVNPKTIKRPVPQTTIDNTVQRLTTEQESSPTSDELFLQKLQDTIEKHIGDEDFSVGQLSELMAMDRTVLYRRMQQLTGISPSVYIKQIRIKVAERLLCETDLPVSNIAMKTGFSTTKYFSSAFKESTGLSPKAFREERKLVDGAPAPSAE